MPSFFRKVIKKKNNSTNDSDSQQPQSENEKDSSVNPLQYIVGSGQSVGKLRDHNEDTLFSFTSLLSDGRSEELFGLFVIADGMGGHRNGEIASSVSVRVVVRYVLDQLYKVLLDPQRATPAVGIQEILIGAVNEAQKAVMQFAPGGGTTLTIALLLGEQLTISHIGDSRAYFVFPDGSLQQITKDHSLVQRLVDLKEITEEEANYHPQRNVLLKALGQPEPFNADIKTLQIPGGARLLLCSDGLWGVVPQDNLQRILQNEVTPIAACKLLVEEANKNGGPDNISVIVVGISGNTGASSNS